MERYCEQEKNCLRVYVPRELDHHEADRLKQEADFFIETGQVKTLVFDFAGNNLKCQHKKVKKRIFLSFFSRISPFFRVL